MDFRQPEGNMIGVRRRDIVEQNNGARSEAFQDAPGQAPNPAIAKIRSPAVEGDGKQAQALKDRPQTRIGDAGYGPEGHRPDAQPGQNRLGCVDFHIQRGLGFEHDQWIMAMGMIAHCVTSV